MIQRMTMGKHFTFGDSDTVTSKDTGSGDVIGKGDETFGFRIDRSGDNFSFGAGNRGRGRGEHVNLRGTRGSSSFRSRGRGNFRGRGGGNFRGRGRGDGKFRGRGCGRFSGHGNLDEAEKPKLGILSDEMMAYYRQVSATVEAGFDDDEPEVKKNFLDNVYIAVKDEGVKVSQNQTVSHILEGLLPHSQPAHLRILFCEFCNHLTTVSFDRFASHVFQSLIQYIPDMYDDEQLEEEEKKSFKAVVEKLCEFSLSEMNQFLTDTYGSHILRSLLEVLGGVEVKEEIIRSNSSRNKRKDFDSKKNLQLRKNVRLSKELSSDFQSEFNAIKSEVVTIMNDEAVDHLTDANFCLVLQSLLLILHKSNTTEYEQIAQMLMEKARPPLANTEADDGDFSKNLPAIVQDSVGSYLIELLVSLASESVIPMLYKKVFKGRLSNYALHPVANYILQKLCTSLANNPKCLAEVVMELAPFMEDILACNHIGVITKMAEACQGNQALQKTLTQAVMKAFHCDDSEEKRKKITTLVASMTVYEVFFPSHTPKENAEGEEEETEKGGVSNKATPRLLKTISIHGSLLLQQMVQFENPKYVVTGLLALTPAELSKLASDQCGSHIIEAFFNSSTVWDKQKDEFVRKLKGFYINIACNKNGSRCLEGMWKGCAIKNKIFIAEELLKNRQRLESDRFGRFLWYNFNLMKFATRQKDWINYQSSINKKEKLLQDILEGGSNKKNKNRKRQAEEPNSGGAFAEMAEGDEDDTTTPAKKKKTGGIESESPNKKEKKKHEKNKKGKT